MNLTLHMGSLWICQNLCLLERDKPWRHPTNDKVRDRQGRVIPRLLIPPGDSFSLAHYQGNKTTIAFYPINIDQASQVELVVKKVKVRIVQLCPTLCNPVVYTVHGILQARILEWVAFPFSRDFPNPGIEPRSPPLQADSLLAEPQRKPKNTGVGILSLLQGIFLTQE